MRRLIVLSLVVAACGPSAAEVKKAKSSAYKAPFAKVWEEVSAEVNAKFKDKMKVEDAVNGYLETDWKKVETTQDSTEGTTDSKANISASSVRAGIFMRMLVKIDGPEPWRIAVDIEAAQYKPDMAMLIPFKHGVADEPPWVPEKIDRMYYDIYERLKPYAVDVTAAPAR
jgi:hypothetical protein